MHNALVRIFAIAISLTAAYSNAAENGRSSMARLASYLSPSREAEADFARSAAPASVSSRADVLVLGPTGYEIQSRGNNGFLCYVERSWAHEPGDPEFWNPRIRSPMCLNAAAVRSVLPSYLEKTKWVLAGATEKEVSDRIQQNVKTGKFSAPESGAMIYMMSKQQYLNNDGRSWRPHVMFLFPSSVASESWGANLDESPVLSDTSLKLEHIIIFMVPVARWSDGSLAATFPPPAAHKQQ